MGSKPTKDHLEDETEGDRQQQLQQGGVKRSRRCRLLETLDDHDDAINCMTLSDDGSLLVTGGEDCTARMWSTRTNSFECLGVLEGHSGYITCIAITDTYVITGSADNTLRKWAMTTCDCLFVYHGHTSRITRIISTGKLIFSSAYDKLAIAWLFDAEDLDDDNEKAALLKTFKGHSKGVYPLVFIRAVGIQTDDTGTRGQVDVHPGDLLITGSADCTARSWSVDTGTCLKIFEGHTLPIMCMSVDATGQTLFTGGGDNTVKSWDIRSGELMHDFVGHGSAVIGLQVVNRILYTMSCDQTARSWVAEFGDCTRVYKGHKHTVTCMKYCDGILFTGCSDGVARAFDAKSGTLEAEFKGHQGSITALTLVNMKLCTSCVDGRLRVFDASHLVAEDSAPPMAGPIERLERNNKKLQELEAKLDGYVKDDQILGSEDVESGHKVRFEDGI